MLRLSLKCGGLESKFEQKPRPLDRSEMGWSRLRLGYKRGVCFMVPTWLWSSTVVRTGTWKVIKLF